MKHRGSVSGVIQKLFAIHNGEIDEVRRGIKDFGFELGELTEVVRGVISDFKRNDSEKVLGRNSK
jgi:hypothetical protein